MNNRKPAEEYAVHFEVNDKLPHCDEMLLIHGTAYKDEEIIRLSFTVPPDTIFTTPAKLLTPLAMIEMLAQLCGAQHSFDEELDGGRLCGYLVGIDKVSFSEPVYVGDRLDLAAWKILEMKEIKRVKGQVSRGGTLVGQAELTLYKTDGWVSLPEIAGSQNQCPVGAGRQCWPRAGEKDAVGKGIVQSICDIKIKPGESVEAALCFGPDFVGFSGHFPGHPVLPGVAILQTGWLLAEMCADKELELCSIKKARFAAPVYPLDRLDVTVKQMNHDDKQSGEYSVTAGCRGTLAAKYTFGAEPTEKSVQK